MPRKALSTAEFIAMLAMAFGAIAFSIDSMLPAMGQIARELAPGAPNDAQLIITSYVLGLGIGTFFTGPMADAWGRKSVIVGGAAVYCIGALAAWWAPSLETMTLARMVQGLAAAAPRVAGMAMVRDLYAGREMARIMSFIMMVFVLVPAAAPLLGSAIMALADWRAIYLSFVGFALISALWIALRQPETLTPQSHRPLRAGPIWAGLRELLAMPRVTLSIGALSLAYTMIFVNIATTQQIFEQTFDRAQGFPLWFALISLFSAVGGLINARLVPRFGMRRIAWTALVAQAVFSGVMVALVSSIALPPVLYFALYMVWIWTVFLTAGGFTIANMNSLALEPVGHLAGLASSVITAFSTVASALLAALGGAFFDGTPLASVATVAICAALAAVCVGWIRD